MRLLARSRLEGMSGTPHGFVPDERERAALQEIIDSLFPVVPRARGTIYDSYIGNLDIAQLSVRVDHGARSRHRCRGRHAGALRGLTGHG